MDDLFFHSMVHFFFSFQWYVVCGPVVAVPLVLILQLKMTIFPRQIRKHVADIFKFLNIIMRLLVILESVVLFSFFHDAMRNPFSVKVAYYSFMRVQEVYTINVQI